MNRSAVTMTNQSSDNGLVQAGATAFDLDNHGKPIGAHPADLYCPASTAPLLESLSRIGDAERIHYRSAGYLAVEKVFSSESIEAAKAGILDLVAGKNPDFTGVSYEAAAADQLPTMTPEQRLDAMRKLIYFVEFDERLKALAYDPELLAAVSFLMGGRKPSLYADQALSKPPRIGREKPWHQDLAFFNFDPFTVPVVGVWIALDPVDLENGCMQLLPGRHREGPILHFKRRDFQICDRDIQGTPSVAVPLPAGGALFFDGLLPHGTPPNSSNRRRRALQFHYVPENSKKSEDARLLNFGSEGKDAQC